MHNFILTVAKDTKWKYVAISTLIAVALSIIFNIIIFNGINKFFVYWFNNVRDKSLEISEYSNHANEFINSWRWIPLYALSCMASQFIACRYLASKTKDKELTNALMLGVASVILIYQFNLIYSVIALSITLLTAYKYKNTTTIKINLGKTT